MNRLLTLLTVLGIGGALMYIFDPDRGRRRRALVRDQVVHLVRTSSRSDATWRDIANRASGLMATARSAFESQEVEDDVLKERVRAKIGRLVGRPSAIEVIVQDGTVTLRGPVLAKEVRKLMGGVYTVKGVKHIVNQLEVHESPEGVPGLQGEPEMRREARPELFQEVWAPTTRLIAGFAGGLLTLYGMRRGGFLGPIAGLAGTTILARGVTNMPLRRLFGIGAGRRAVDIQKTINIDAPVEKVFRLWTNYENFPRFMSNVKEVTRIDDQRSHWKVAGPAGIPVEWDSVVTKLEPNKVFAWKTVEGSLIEHSGVVNFDSNPDGSTRVDIKMSYNPAVGGVGHLVASLFGADPKREMDEDLLRMKSFIETGKIPARAAAA